MKLKRPSGGMVLIWYFSVISMIVGYTLFWHNDTGLFWWDAGIFTILYTLLYFVIGWDDWDKCQCHDCKTKRAEMLLWENNQDQKLPPLH